MGDDAREVAEAYSAHARGYADAWSPVIRPLGQRMLACLPWARARRVLDLGTGTGALLPDIRAAAIRPGPTAFRTTYGRTMRKLGSLDPVTHAAFLERVRARLSALDGAAFVYRAAVVCGIARRPR